MPSRVEAQPSWYDGLIQYSSITNCGSIIQGFPYNENGAGAFVGFLAQPTATRPAPNITYYIRVYVAGLGNSCSGQRFYLDVALPPNTTLAITGTDKVYCLADGVAVSAAECSQTLFASSLNPGAFALYSNDSAHANLWPLPQGHSWEFQIPVRSSTTLTSATLQANVKVLDGNSSPWLRPTQGVYVFSNQPTILYPSPSTINICRRRPAPKRTSTPTAPACPAPAPSDSARRPVMGSLPNRSRFRAVLPRTSHTWSWTTGPPALQPDTLYHWRFKFTPTGGATIFGPDQTFRTRPDGKVTIGNGSAANCTEAAFTTAFNTAGTKQIVFDCGAFPVTINITSTRTVSSPTFSTLLIDGGSKVTLQRVGTGNHFNVTSGATLTLKSITLTNGFATCGGAVNVASGAGLSLDDARFINNQSSQQGGAICNNGIMSVTNALFSDNVAGSHGGAIGNYSALNVTNSRFLNNRASINGGGIDSVGSLQVFDSTFAGNAAGFRGGGINVYVGNGMNIFGSSFFTNTAGLYGGGVSIDGGGASISGSTFSANSSNNFGGAIEMSGDQVVSLTNSTLTDNTAVTEGGGIYRDATTTGVLHIRSSTIADNVAGTTGGSIYNGSTGGHTALIDVTSTILSGGIPANCSGTMVTGGYNLESTNSCGFSNFGDKTNVVANLGPLLKNAGTTMTRLPLPGSQAIDGGTNDFRCQPTDQQGLVRPQDSDGNGTVLCDIGAAEVKFPTPTITRISPDGGPIAGGRSVTITGTNLSGVTVTIGGAGAIVNSTTVTTATVVTPAHAAGPVNVSVIHVSFGSATATDGYTYFPLVGPATLTATATSSTAVALSWAASSGAASYEVWRSSQGGQFSLVLSPTSTSASDTGLTANTTYLYKVRAVAAAGTSGFSLTDAATTILFTDTSLAGVPIKAVHLTELRTAINAMRIAAGLDAIYFTNPTVASGSMTVKRVHLLELRAALNAARSALGLAALGYTNTTITARTTVISSAHVTELRAGTQ